MSTVGCLRAAWDALSANEQAAVRAAVVVPETGWLALPATEIIDGQTWAIWDDPLLGPAHAESLAAAIELFA